MRSIYRVGPYALSVGPQYNAQTESCSGLNCNQYFCVSECMST